MSHPSFPDGGHISHADIDLLLPCPRLQAFLRALRQGAPRTASGARDDPEEALADLLAELAALGLITDNTHESNWWDPGAAGLPIWGAWQARGAASLSASYTDLSGNSNDLSVGSAPSWATASGWSFNGSTHYLDTGFTPDSDQSQSLIVQFSGFSTGGSDQKVAAGMTNGPGDENFSTQLAWNHSTTYGYRNGNYRTVTTGQRASGNLCVAGSAGYYNGAAEVSSIGAWADTPGYSVYIGGRNNAGSLQYPAAVTIQAVAIYDGTLTAAQVSAVATAMAAL
jgi:hypothetical protein